LGYVRDSTFRRDLIDPPQMVSELIDHTTAS